MIALSTLKNFNLHNNESNAYTEHFYKHYTNTINVPPLISVLTDYTTHSTWIQNEIDYYIVGHEYVKELLVFDGVEPSKIRTFGIPVENLFSHRDKDIVLSELNLSPDKLTVLLMGVALGLEI